MATEACRASIPSSVAGFCSDAFRSLSPVSRRLVLGAFWATAGVGLSRGLQLLSFVFVARILGVAEFGRFGMAQSTVATFGTAAGLGMGLTSTKFISEFRAQDPAKAGRVIALTMAVAGVAGFAASAVLFIFATPLAARMLAEPRLAVPLRIGAAMLFLSGIAAAQTGTLAGFEAFRQVARVNLWSGVASFPIAVGATAAWGLHGAMWGLVASAAVVCVLNEREVRRQAAAWNIGYRVRGFWRERDALWRFSLPSVLGALIASASIWAGNALLVNQPRGYDELGIYNAVLRMKQLPEAVVSILTMPILPILSERLGRGAVPEYRQALRHTFSLTWICIVPVSLVQIAIPWLTALPFGSAFSGHWQVVRWLMLQACMMGLFAPVSAVVASANRMWLGLAINAWWAALFLGSTALLVTQYGASGLAAAFGVAHAVSSLSFVVYLRRIDARLLAGIPILSRFCFLLIALPVCFCTVLFKAEALSWSVGLACAVGSVWLGVRGTRAARA